MVRPTGLNISPKICDVTMSCFLTHKEYAYKIDRHSYEIFYVKNLKVDTQCKQCVVVVYMLHNAYSLFQAKP